jgi:hypothetical protein
MTHLKGQSHEKVGEIRPRNVSLGSKSCYWLLNFFWSALSFLWSFKDWILLNKTTTGTQLEGPCSSQDANLVSCEECCVYRALIAGYLESWALTLLASWTLIPNWHWSIMCEDWRTENIWIRCANPLAIKDFFWLLICLLWRAFTIRPMTTDQHKQIGIRRGALSLNMWTVFMKQNGNFEKSQDLRSEKFKNYYR